MMIETCVCYMMIIINAIFILSTHYLIMYFSLFFISFANYFVLAHSFMYLIIHLSLVYLFVYIYLLSFFMYLSTYLLIRLSKC